jgi:transcriptional regulator with XRE-family HTH domain
MKFNYIQQINKGVAMSRVKLGELVRKLRKKKGLSLRGLAEKITDNGITKISYVNITHIENGRIETSKKILKEIAIALEYDIDKLLATASTIDNELENIINKKPDTVPDFLRTAKNLTNKEWDELKGHLENIKDRKSKK